MFTGLQVSQAALLQVVSLHQSCYIPLSSGFMGHVLMMNSGAHESEWNLGYLLKSWTGQVLCHPTHFL